jgi:hypothetical protein
MAQYISTGFIGEKKPVEGSPARELELTAPYTGGNYRRLVGEVSGRLLEGKIMD